MAQVLDREKLDDILDALHPASESRHDAQVTRADTARTRLADCDRRLARYRAALVNSLGTSQPGHVRSSSREGTSVVPHAERPAGTAEVMGRPGVQRARSGIRLRDAWSRPHARWRQENVPRMRQGDWDYLVVQVGAGEEHGEDEAGRAGRAGGDESTPAVLVELLAHRSAGMPSSPARLGHAEANSGESSGVGEVGHLQGRDLVTPQVTRQSAGRRDGCCR
jgi:hypothetical protein